MTSQIQLRLVSLLLVLLASAGCGSPPNTNTASTNVNVAQPTPTQRSSPLTEFEEALRYVKNGQYAYIFVFSRKDGKPLEPTDSVFLRTNAPQVVDWVRADKEGKKIIAGTNFNLEEGNLAQIKKRFVVEDWTGK